ncbi:MAG: single-stranded DNA-binding protein [Planctomycetes bacterium SCN 63-9]|nr:MAG: single-stranded DNA-binding protein [Planctomycetes bacterium SCN 63-9]
MADLNKVFLMGRLTFDPELRRIPSGTAVAELRLATSRSWSGRDGERREETLYIDVTVWDRQAETCCQYLKKGSPVHVEGYLKMESWDDKTTGEKRSKIRVQAERVQFLDSRRGDSGGMDGEYSSSSPMRESAPPRRNNGNGFSGESRGGGRGGYSQAAGSGATSGPRPSVEGEGEEEDIPF